MRNVNGFRQRGHEDGDVYGPRRATHRRRGDVDRVRERVARLQLVAVRLVALVARLQVLAALAPGGCCECGAEARAEGVTT